MKPEQQRIAIAEECGWTFKEKDGQLFSYHPKSKVGRSPHTWELPDYLNDLNAIIGAVKSLPRDKMLTVLNYLQFIAMNDSENSMNEKALATPDQWSEAFIRGVGRWEE